MAPTKRKRRTTKHRGNAAGGIESRGRTGRPLSETERKAAAASGAKGPRSRQDRWDQPPTWRGAMNRAAIAAVIFVALVLLVFQQPVQSAIPLGLFMVLVYIPLGYYTDRWLYNRRHRNKPQG